ncbi:hypothetical protein FB567DRAFT_52386 [Paraphoma chrysanthemicola]|uniref:Protein kinase domain-containing protein n=1 Tax=Paraphoma chrysanthemicola TaxID=798071 RepID=A0A8K0R7E5_9PLEO|nr:hypothetical protein FB567DRAFT_52386 [Paraphoma chrysanthemicola]
MPVLETLAFAIGTSGLLPVIKAGFRIALAIHEIDSIPSNVISYHTKLDIESIRFIQWLENVFGTTIYDQEDSFDPFTADLPKSLEAESILDIKPAIYQALWEVQTLLREVGEIFKDLGIKVKEPFGRVPDTSKPKLEKDAVQAQRTEMKKSVLKKLSITQKLGYNITTHKRSPGERLERLHESLEAWNSKLEGLVGRQRENIDRAVVMSRAIGRRSQSDLLDVMQNMVFPKSPELSDGARFKLDRLQILGDNSLKLVERTDPGMWSPPTDRSSNRKMQTMNTDQGLSSVIVEWKATDSQLSSEQKKIPMKRMAMLATILRHEDKPAGLRSLDCIGWTTQMTTVENFGLIYKMPDFAQRGSKPTGLDAAFTKLTPTLPERFQLATTLALAMLEYHCMEWVHKAFFSSNVLLFKGQNGELVLSKPYISGFEYSRPDDPQQVTLPNDVQGRLKFDCRQHPDVFRGRDDYRYSRKYDFYSLGFVLLEIALWRRVREDIVRTSVMNPDNALEVLNSIAGDVGHRMGSKYRNAVVACLNWDDEDEDIDQFYLKVVQPLTTCQCGMR